jgi:hypothetical protein
MRQWFWDQGLRYRTCRALEDHWYQGDWRRDTEFSKSGRGFCGEWRTLDEAKAWLMALMTMGAWASWVSRDRPHTRLPITYEPTPVHRKKTHVAVTVCPTCKGNIYSTGNLYDVSTKATLAELQAAETPELRALFARKVRP